MGDTYMEGGAAQVSTQNPNFDPHVRPSELARLLVMSEAQLDREICRELLRRPERYQWQLVNEMSRIETGRPLAFLMPFKKYIELKGRILRYPGRLMAGLLRSRMNNGGRDFCQRIGYCKNKHRFKDALGTLEKLGPEQAWLTEEGYERLKEEFPELVEVAEEGAGALADEVIDNLVPGALVVKMVKYGLDDLCPCCKVCGGRGRIEGDTSCEKCAGSGLQTPFPGLP